MAEKTVAETKMGRIKDKILKNKLAIEKTPGVEDLGTEVFTGDDGLTLVELSAFGVLGSVTPVTNPTETIINNTIGALAGGNSIVFCPHPSAKNICLWLIKKLNGIITEAGGPENLVTSASEAKKENVQALDKINLTSGFIFVTIIVIKILYKIIRNIKRIWSKAVYNVFPLTDFNSTFLEFVSEVS